MEERRLWMLFFDTGRPEVYLEICRRRESGGDGETESLPAFHGGEEENRLL